MGYKIFQDPKLPGFLPVEIFRDKTDNQLRHQQCQRCYIMSEYNIALKMNVAPEDYPKTIAHLKETPAVIVLIVDLLDFPGSVRPRRCSSVGRASFKGPSLVQLTWVRFLPQHRVVGKILAA